MFVDVSFPTSPLMEHCDELSGKYTANVHTNQFCVQCNKFRYVNRSLVWIQYESVRCNKAKRSGRRERGGGMVTKPSGGGGGGGVRERYGNKAIKWCMHVQCNSHVQPDKMGGLLISSTA